MELKLYLRILFKRWWIVVPVSLVTLIATIVFTYTQVPTYTSTATFIVSPDKDIGDVRNFASGLDILSRRTEIATTYAEVARSHLIKREVAEEMELTSKQIRGLVVESRLRAGTNVLEITVQGSDPELVKDFANMVGAKVIVFAGNLYEAFGLVTLDEALRPTNPVKPDRKLNIILGAVFGLALGVGMAFLSEYLQSPLESAVNLSIFDEETGVYNKLYFSQRLREEMSRAKRNSYPLSLALMNIDQLDVMKSSFTPQSRSEALRKVAVFLKQYLREEDLMARVEGSVFAFLLPDMTEDIARSVMEKLQTRIAWTPFELEKSGVRLNLSSATGVVAYQYNGTSQEEFMAQANQALQQAESAGYGKVRSLSEQFEELDQE